MPGVQLASSNLKMVKFSGANLKEANFLMLTWKGPI
ncbi:MAG: pentapeptide repeat-containing protein [Ardenticatenaceae bacterium]|nr:pentapeptide repeat-containing protein [Ardenticatenaceae bacterium]